MVARRPTTPRSPPSPLNPLAHRIPQRWKAQGSQRGTQRLQTDKTSKQTPTGGQKDVDRIEFTFVSMSVAFSDNRKMRVSDTCPTRDTPPMETIQQNQHESPPTWFLVRNAIGRLASEPAEVRVFGADWDATGTRGAKLRPTSRLVRFVGV